MPRKPGYTHNQRSRDAIQATLLVRRLEQHVMADAPLLDSSQVNGIKILLAKVLPDLSQVDQRTTLDVTDPIAALFMEIAANGKRIGKS